MRGAEIGPLSHPLIGKDESDIYYVDHCSAEDLRKKYAGDPNVNPDNIAPIDYIWSDRPANDLLRDICPLDYVIASHVIEHVPDLIGWLHEMHDTLGVGGSLVLAVPDKRFTFDAYRRTSAMEEIRLGYAERRRRPGLRCIMDHFANVIRAETWAMWDDYEKIGEFPFVHDPSFLSLAAAHYAEGRYVDVHCWVFTPWSFLETIGHIVRETGLGFDLQYFRTTSFHDLEFYVRLARVAGSTTDWTAEAAAARANALWPEKSARTRELAESPTAYLAPQGAPETETLQVKLAEATRRAELAEIRSSELAARAAALESSTSWRITAPMRTVARALRG
jgi:SAM-dependent methyltransferase